MSTRRVDLGEAAKILGITREAVRRRAKRGTLPSEHGADGKLYVWVAGVHPHAHHGVHDSRAVSGVDDRDLLLDRMASEIEYLREESRRKDTIIMSLAQRIPPQLEAPREAPREMRESPVAASEPEPRGDTPSDEARRPWWLRWLGVEQKPRR